MSAMMVFLSLLLSGCAQKGEEDAAFAEPEKPSFVVLVPSPSPEKEEELMRLQDGMAGEEVMRLQARLVELGYLKLSEASQRYDPSTKKAVWLFQSQNGLPADGGAGIDTQALLYSDDAKQCNSFSDLAPTVGMGFAELVMSDDGTRNQYPKGYPAVGTYKIIVDIAHQVTMVYTKDAEGNYTVPVRYMLCSTGKNDCTPKGTFKMDKYHVRFSQFVRDKTYGQYWTQIRGAIYFHSILYSQFDTSSYIEEVWERFGKADSHGCIRLTVPDAKWMWYHIAPGTECVIRSGDPDDEEVAAIREQLVLAPLPEERLDMEPEQIPNTDNWEIDEVPADVPFVQGSQN